MAREFKGYPFGFKHIHEVVDGNTELGKKILERGKKYEIEEAQNGSNSSFANAIEAGISEEAAENVKAPLKEPWLNKFEKEQEEKEDQRRKERNKRDH